MDEEAFLVHDYCGTHLQRETRDVASEREQINKSVTLAIVGWCSEVDPKRIGVKS